MDAKDQKFDVATMFSSDWIINGTEVEEELGDYMHERLGFELSNPKNSLCPHCRGRFRCRNFDDTIDGNDEWHNDRTYIVKFCTKCAHWEFLGSEGGNKCMDPQSNVILSSVAAKFDPCLPPICSKEFAQYIRRNPNSWHTMNPTRFEQLVADIFKANYKNCEVFHVGGPGDQGVDVLFVDSDEKKWMIQVKRRENPKKAEGFATLQSVLGTLALKGERHGIIVSTSDSFSYYARKAQEEAGRRGFVIRMIDKGKIDRMLGRLLPNAPWEDVFSLPALGHVSADVKDYFKEFDHPHFFDELFEEPL